MGMLQHYDLAQELLIKRYMTKGTETFLLSSSYERDEVELSSHVHSVQKFEILDLRA